MTDNPIDFAARLQAKRAVSGEGGMMTCECQIDKSQPKGFIPVLQHDAGGEYVAGLACAACGCGHMLINGRLCIGDHP